MKSPSEVIPKFFISLEKDTDRLEYLKNDVFPLISNHIKCKAFDPNVTDPNSFLEENNILIAEHFIEKCNVGQLGCFISHFQVWKYIADNNLDLSIIMEDDVKIYKNFNEIIDKIFDNLPNKYDYVHLFIHPDKQKAEYLSANDGDITIAEENFGTVAYMITCRGAKRLDRDGGASLRFQENGLRRGRVAECRSVCSEAIGAIGQCRLNQRLKVLDFQSREV